MRVVSPQEKFCQATALYGIMLKMIVNTSTYICVSYDLMNVEVYRPKELCRGLFHGKNFLGNSNGVLVRVRSRVREDTRTATEVITKRNSRVCDHPRKRHL